MSNDRLAELRRQRALVAEHMAWLEREIAVLEALGAGKANKPVPEAQKRAVGAPSPALATGLTAESKGPGRTTANSPVVSATAAQAMEAEAERILESHRTNPSVVKQSVFRGCLMYLAFAFLLTVLAAALFYFIFQARANLLQEP